MPEEMGEEGCSKGEDLFEDKIADVSSNFETLNFENFESSNRSAISNLDSESDLSSNSGLLISKDIINPDIIKPLDTICSVAGIQEITSTVYTPHLVDPELITAFNRETNQPLYSGIECRPTHEVKHSTLGSGFGEDRSSSRRITEDSTKINADIQGSSSKIDIPTQLKSEIQGSQSTGDSTDVRGRQIWDEGRKGKDRSTTKSVKIFHIFKSGLSASRRPSPSTL